MTDPDSDPAGFQRYQRRPDEYRSGIDLLVPTQLKSVLVEDDKRRRKEAEAKEAEDMAAEVKLKQSLQNRGTPPAYSARPAVRDDPETEMLAWDRIDDTDKIARSRANYPVFKSGQALALLKNLGKDDSDDSARLKKIYRELLKRGTTLRKIARPKSMNALAQLAARQPHMKEVVNFVMAQITLARRSRKPVRLQPMLLLGEPGVGKTYFAQALAKALSTTIHLQQMDSDLTSSFLMGADRKWSNSEHGMLFDWVILGEHANPVIVLDELDKSQRNTSYGSPLSSLYSVLEPLSASCVRDISLLFEFDASQVTWIATANDAHLLDQPLRSRFREFHIMQPAAEECLVLAEEVMRAAIKSVAVKGFKTDLSMRRHLAHLPARQISQLTLQAVANAVAAHRNALGQEDFPLWLFDDEVAIKSGGKPYIH